MPPNLNVLPAQANNLPPDLDRSVHMGVEIEYDSNGISLASMRRSLYNVVGIDTYDMYCPIRTHREHRPARPEGDDPSNVWTLRLPCSHQLAESESSPPDCSRATHILRGSEIVWPIPSVDGVPVDHALQPVYDHFGHDGLSAHAHTHNHGQSGGRYTVMHGPLAAAIARDMPSPDDPDLALWVLTTDPTAGHELKSPPRTLDTRFLSVLRNAVETLDYEGTVPTGDCGIHVHHNMRQYTEEQVKRVWATYRLCEPLILAAVSPSRYTAEGYNRPSYSQDDSHASKLKSGTAELAERLGHRCHLDSGQYTHHGTFEWRHLETTYDRGDLVNWVRLVNRFTQAAVQSPLWGIKLKKLAPIGVDRESISSFLRFMGLNRKGIHNDLKDMREWYIDRVRSHWTRPAFDRLTPESPHAAQVEMAKLGDIRKEGKSPFAGQVCEILQDAQENETYDPDTIGKEFVTALMHCISRVGVSPNNTSILSRIDTTGILEYISLYHYDCPESDVFGPGDWNNFAAYFVDLDQTNLGEWIVTHVLDAPDGASSLFLNMINRWTRNISSGLNRSRNRPDIVNETIGKVVGEDSCVEF